MTPEWISAISSSVSAVFAGAALIGLYLYTKYTKHMMESSDSAFRVGMEPLLVPDVDLETLEDFIDQTHFNLTISNEGKGPALQASYIQLEDQESLRQYGSFFEFPSELGRSALGTVKSGQTLQSDQRIQLAKPALGFTTLIVLSYRDATNTWHQCQIKYTQVNQLEWQTDVVYCRKASRYPVSRYSYPKLDIKG